jgi:hypothetical protein
VLVLVAFDDDILRTEVVEAAGAVFGADPAVHDAVGAHHMPEFEAGQVGIERVLLPKLGAFESLGVATLACGLLVQQAKEAL